jgi:hypothetical protein
MLLLRRDEHLTSWCRGLMKRSVGKWARLMKKISISNLTLLKQPTRVRLEYGLFITVEWFIIH